MSREKAFVEPDTIIKTAFELINRGGYSNFSIRILAEELKVTPMTLYNYAENKMDIIRGVILEGIRQITKHLEDELLQEKQPVDVKTVYRVLSRVFFLFAVEHRNIYRLMFNTNLDELRGNPELTEAYGGAFGLVRGQVTPERAKTLKKEILLFEILMNGLLLRHLNNPEGFDRSQYDDMIETALDRLLIS